MRSLPDLVQSLPGELYDEIRALTFTADTKEVFIDRKWKPPSCLQVSRDTPYYENSTFYIKECHVEEWVHNVLVSQSTVDLACPIRVYAPFLNASRMTLRTLHRHLRYRCQYLANCSMYLQRDDFFQLQVAFDQFPGKVEWLSIQEVASADRANGPVCFAYHWYMRTYLDGD